MPPRSGVGPGKVCITKLKTGFGTGGWQLSALKWCARVATKPIVADGGIRHHGDIAKSVRFGAAMVMVGSLFAGHEESPGATVEVDGKLYKEYYGSASDFNKGEYKHVEGKRILEPIKGRLADTLREMREDVQSSISYAGGARAGRPEEGQLRHPGRRERRRAPVHVAPRAGSGLPPGVSAESWPCVLRLPRWLNGVGRGRSAPACAWRLQPLARGSCRCRRTAPAAASSGSAGEPWTEVKSSATSQVASKPSK